MEPENPDELVEILTNWLRQAHSSEGKLLPNGIDTTEWAVRQFIDLRKDGARRAMESVEESLSQAQTLCASGAAHEDIAMEIDMARQTLACDLRDHLGLYDWNKEQASRTIVMWTHAH